MKAEPHQKRRMTTNRELSHTKMSHMRHITCGEIESKAKPGTIYDNKLRVEPNQTQYICGQKESRATPGTVYCSAKAVIQIKIETRYSL